VQYNIPIANLARHWTLCYEKPYHEPTSLRDLKCEAGSQCKEEAVCGTGNKVLFGWRRKGASELGAAAMGTTRPLTLTGDVVTNPILTESAAALQHNGAFWYLTGDTFGFAASNATLLDKQDIATSLCAARVSWALNGNGGFRAGCTCAHPGCADVKDLSSDTQGANFYKVIYYAD